MDSREACDNRIKYHITLEKTDNDGLFVVLDYGTKTIGKFTVSPECGVNCALEAASRVMQYHFNNKIMPNF